jgi:hypothetical protein
MEIKERTRLFFLHHLERLVLLPQRPVLLLRLAKLLLHLVKLFGRLLCWEIYGQRRSGDENGLDDDSIRLDDGIDDYVKRVERLVNFSITLG